MNKKQIIILITIVILGITLPFLIGLLFGYGGFTSFLSYYLFGWFIIFVSFVTLTASVVVASIIYWAWKLFDATLDKLVG